MHDIFGEPAGTGSEARELVAAADTATLHDCITESVARGWLLSFGRSRDGYAVSVSVLDAGRVSRKWCGDSEELQRALEAVLSAATAEQAEEPPKGKRRPRKPV